MSKILDATCAANIVTSGGMPVPSADILSQGIGPSQGILVLDDDRATYVTSNALDLKMALEQIAAALTQIASALTLIDAKPLGTLPPAPAASANVTLISAAQAQLSVLKETLK